MNAIFEFGLCHFSYVILIVAYVSIPFAFAVLMQQPKLANWVALSIIRGMAI